MRIFVSAYACEPGLGSEIGVGWHWVTEMSKYFELWVLTRESNRRRIEDWFMKNPDAPKINFVYFDLPSWARKWKKGLRGVRLYYNLWIKFSNSLVEKTMKENDIKIFHHITYGNALWPVSKYGSSQTFIWGPIGGLETISEEFSRHYEKKARWIERLRQMAVKRAVKSRALRKRVERASLIFCKTEDTLNLLPLENKSKAVLFTDVAADSQIYPENEPKVSIDNSLNLICVGRLDAWRGFDLAILALKEARGYLKVVEVRLTIVGKGNDLYRLQKIVKDSSLDSFVTFTGEVSKEEYHRLMSASDVVLNPALKEGAVTVSFDAMSMGKPLIAIDSGGFTRYFTSEYSMVVPRESREKTIEKISDAIVRLSDPNLRERMGKAALQASEKFTWENHGKEIFEVITKTGL